MLVYFGKDTAQEVEIKTVADVAGSLSGKYFLFHTAAGVKHYAWFNVTGSASVDPAPAGGWIGHSVVITSGAPAVTVASALQAVLTAVSGFTATVLADTVTLKNTLVGYAQPARDAEAALAATGFSFQVTVLGQLEESAGSIQGDISVTNFHVNKVEVKAHSTGSTVQQEIPVGVSKPEISFTLQETSKDRIEKIFNQLGYGSVTGVGADKTKGFGFGTSVIGASVPKIPVRFHPVSLDLSNKSEDWNFWKTNLTVDSFTFAAEAVATIPVKFAVYPDDSKNKNYNLIMIGDASSAI